MKLIMTKGLPGSGKTHFAKEYLEANPNTVLVCKDDLRAMLFNSAWTGNREKFILKARDFIVSSALESGRSVIVHDTNFHPKHEARLKELAKQYKAELEVRDLTHVPVEQCIHNDLHREDSVGEKVIREMYRDWIKPMPPIIEYDSKLPEAIICDVDGTLALFGDANPYERDFSKDKLNQPIYNILSAFGAACDDGWGDVTRIIVSGRKDKFREETESWLKSKGIVYDYLFMRKAAPEGEKEPKDTVVKKEIYEQEVKGKYNVLFVLDDRNQVVELWRSLGLTCLQVAEGDF